MCDFLKANTGAAEAATAAAQSQMREALQKQLDARQSAEAAADGNSEGARLANEAALRRLARGGMFGVADPSSGSTAPVVTRQLFGQ